jgi:hypothetical protein
MDDFELHLKTSGNVSKLPSLQQFLENLPVHIQKVYIFPNFCQVQIFNWQKSFVNNLGCTKKSFSPFFRSFWNFETYCYNVKKRLATKNRTQYKRYFHSSEWSVQVAFSTLLNTQISFWNVTRSLLYTKNLSWLSHHWSTLSRWSS